MDPRQVLAAPRRRRVFELIEETGPIGVADLAAAVGLHENTVRLHVAALAEAGLVEREQSLPAPGPGRRAHRYRAAGADPVREADAYHRLAAWLAEAVRTQSSARTAGRLVGAREGRSETLAGLFQREGFAPEWDASGNVLVLHRCPFAAAAREDSATICALHLGLAEGVAEAAGDIKVERLVPVADPARGGCRLYVSRPDSQPPSSTTSTR